MKVQELMEVDTASKRKIVDMSSVIIEIIVQFIEARTLHSEFKKVLKYPGKTQSVSKISTALAAFGCCIALAGVIAIPGHETCLAI